MNPIMYRDAKTEALSKFLNIYPYPSLVLDGLKFVTSSSYPSGIEYSRPHQFRCVKNYIENLILKKLIVTHLFLTTCICNAFVYKNHQEKNIKLCKNYVKTKNEKIICFLSNQTDLNN